MELLWRRPFLKVPVTPCICDMSTALNGVPKHSRHHDHVDFFGSRIKASQTYMKHVCGTTGSRLKSTCTSLLLISVDVVTLGDRASLTHTHTHTPQIVFDSSFRQKLARLQLVSSQAAWSYLVIWLSDC